MNNYRVRFWNPAIKGSGFIDAYRLAGQAKAAADACNGLYIRDGVGVRAQYLGKRFDKQGNPVPVPPLPQE
jgi:hypothetical protein